MKMINKKVIAIAAVAVISVGIGIVMYVTHNGNSSKASAAYTSKEDKSKDISDGAGSSQNAVSKEKKGEKGTNTTETNKNNSNISTGSTSQPSTGTLTDTASANVDVNFKEFFKSDVFMGDSITEGISYCEFLDDVNVCAKVGINISNTKNEVDRITIQNPRNIYLLYGVNDMDDTMPSQWFVEQYRELLHRVKAKFPNTNIYVQSVLPVAPIVEQKTPHINNKHISETNEGLINMAKQENVNYLNIAAVLNENNRNLYEPDGTHFKTSFYKLWLNYVASNVK